MNSLLPSSWTLLLLCLFIGCDSPSPEKSSHHGHDHGGGAPEGVEFKAGTGLSFSETTLKTLQIKTLEVSESTLTQNQTLMGQIFRISSEKSSKDGVYLQGRYYLLCEIPSNHPLASDSKISTPDDPQSTLRVIKTSTVFQETSQKIEVVIELTPSPLFQAEIGKSISIHVTSSHQKITGLFIPNSALLKTSEGHFVWVMNSEHYLRTPVKIDQKVGDQISISEGLYEADTVVTHPIKELYLIELNAVKGGAHCH